MLIHLLKKSEQEKIKVYNYIFSQDRLSKTFSDITIFLDNTPVNLLKTIDSLNNDLIEIGINNVFISSNKQSCLIENPDNENLFHISEKLLFFYLNHSIRYQILKLVLKNNSYSIVKLSNELSVSQSHCYYLFREINKELVPFKIKLQCKEGYVKLNGNEVNISFFIFLFADAIESLNFLNHPHSSFPSNLFHQSINGKNSNVTANLLESIYKLRRNELDYIKISNNDAKNILLKIHNASPIIKINSELSDKQDLLFFDLFFRIIFPGIDEPKFRITMGKELVKERNPFSENAALISKKILNLYDLFNPISSCPIYYELVYMLSLQSIYLDILRADVKNLFHDSFTEEVHALSKPTYSKIKNDIELTIKKYPINLTDWDDDLHKQKIHCFSDTLSPILFSYMQPHLTIAVQTSSSLMDNVSLKRQLRTFFSEEMIEFTESVDEADLIITDRFMPQSQEKKPCFAIYDKFSINLWNELLIFILSESQKKLLKQIRNDNHI